MDNQLATVDTEELRSRLDQLVSAIDTILRDISPQLKEWSKARIEADVIVQELARRGELQK